MTTDQRTDLFVELSKFGKHQGLPLNDPATIEKFLRSARDTLAQAVDDGTLLHGHRTQRMFEALVVSLGQFRLFKQEDNGLVYPLDEFTAPDFRVVLGDGSQWLIEVKNIYNANPSRQRFEIRDSDLKRLKDYATMTSCELKFALYWAKWCIWTLVDATRFTATGSKWAIDMVAAVQANELGGLGDRMIGTALPLMLRLDVDKNHPRTVSEESDVNLILGSAKMFCADKEIVDGSEKNTAFLFMQFGNWPLQCRAAMTGDEVDAIEYICEPEERSNPDERFEIIGTLSSVFSRYYATKTIDDDKVVQTVADEVPHWFAPLLSREKKSDALPLWKFQLTPQNVRSHR